MIQIARELYKGIYYVDRPWPENALRVDLAALPMVSLMERNGMLIDRERIVALHKTLSEEMEALQAQVNADVGRAVNLASGDQLSALLYDEMRLKQPGKEKWTKSKTRLTVDADVLKGMVSQHPLVRKILDYKVRDKLRSTYTYSLLDLMDQYGYVHPDINHTGTDTGRYACSNPNLQNIPQRTKLGKLVRKAFVAPPGLVYGTCDLSQIEMRHAAEDAKCPNLIDVFKREEDLYWAVTEQIYKRKFSDEERVGFDVVTGLPNKTAFRQNAKIVALGTIYDISPEGLVDNLLSWDGTIGFLTDGDKAWDYDRHYRRAVEICADAINSFFAGYPELLDRRRVHHQRAREMGMVWDCFGRHRWIPQVFSTHSWVAGEGLRAAGNMPIQGGCAGFLKLWMAKIYDRWESYWRRHGLKPVMAVHDEVLVVGPQAVVEDYLIEAADMVWHLLPEDMYSTPLESSIAVAKDWGSLEK